jgi:hypothetical protein
VNCLVPASDRGYLQSVDYIAQTIHPDQSAVRLLRAGQPIELSLGDDLVLNAGTLQPPTAQGPLVFAGYGIHMLEARLRRCTRAQSRASLFTVCLVPPRTASSTSASSRRNPSLW